MKAAKCPNCGANITIDESKEAGICEFCNTPFVTEKALSVVNNTTSTSNSAQTIINNYYTGPAPVEEQPKKVVTEQVNHVVYDVRPEVNVLIAFILFMFYIFPGIIYIGSVKKKQQEWDARHHN